MAESPYQYDNLRSPTAIRLLRVVPGQGSSQPRYSLVEVDLDSPSRPAYRCLSYTWGSALPVEQGRQQELDDRIAIRIHPWENNPGGQIAVTPNLHDFLSRLNGTIRDETMLVWIDALCINQLDLAERATQVSMMNRIYSCCQEVIVWLGVGDADSEAAFALMAVMRDISVDFFESMLGLAREPADEEKISKLGLDKLHSEDWLSFGRFINRNWFHRTWTLQEFLLPPELVFWCGDREFRTLELHRAVVSFRDMGMRAIAVEPETDPLGRYYARLPDRVLGSYLTLKNVTWQFIIKGNAALTTDRPDWASTVAYFSQTRQCMDMRDRVYGILGLLPIDLSVDYRKPTADVFVEYVLATGVEKFVPFSVEHRGRRRTEGLPSWVPDFAVRGGPDPWVQIGANTFNSAGGVGGMKRLQSSDPRVLALPGVFADVVCGIGGKDSDLSSGKCFVNSLALLDTLPHDAGTPDLIECFWRTLVVNVVAGRMAEADKFERPFSALLRFYLAKWLSAAGPGSDDASKLKGALESLRRKSTSNILPQWQDLVASALLFGSQGEQQTSGVPSDAGVDMMVYGHHLRAMFEDRCFFITERNRIGVGPSDLTSGTLVCVVEGRRYPFLLERGTGGRYRLAGHGYVHGIMHGEALGGNEFTRIEIE